LILRDGMLPNNQMLGHGEKIGLWTKPQLRNIGIKRIRDGDPEPVVFIIWAREDPFFFSLFDRKIN